MPVARLMRARIQLLTLMPKNPLTGKGHCGPVFKPNLWRESPTTRARDLMDANDCFHYATNWRVDEHAHQSEPGDNGGPRLGHKTTPALAFMALANDGFVPIGYDDKPPVGFYKIGCWLTDAQTEYHFMRQDTDGFWSDKFGGGSISGHDMAGHRIADPRAYMANKYLSFTVLVGFFILPNYGINPCTRYMKTADLYSLLLGGTAFKIMPFHSSKENVPAAPPKPKPRTLYGNTHIKGRRR